MTRRQGSVSLDKKVYFIIFQTVLFLLIPVNAVFAATASISAPGSEGRFTVSVSGSFPSYVTCNSANPPVCTTCNSGSIALYLNGRSQGGASGDGSANWSRDYDTGSMAQGSHIFSARASDCGGNTDQAEKTIIVDNTPELTINPPGAIEGLIDIGGSVDFKKYDGGEQGAVNDGYVRIYLDSVHRGTKSYEDTASWSYKEITGAAIDAGILSEGEHTLKVSAHAKNYQLVVKEIIFTVDNTPELTINPPGVIEGLMDIGGSVDFKRYDGGEQGAVNDGYVRIYLDSVHRGTKSYEDTASWSYKEITGAAIDAGILSEGEHTLKVSAHAKNGKSVVKEIVFTVDNTPKSTILGTRGYPDNTIEILGTTVFKENTAGKEGSVTLYIKEAGTSSYTRCGSRSFEGKNVSWKYSDFTGTRLQKSVWGQKEIIAKVVATAANGASATVEKPLMVPALGSCSTKF